MSFFMKMWLWVKKFQLPDWLQDILERIFGYALDILKQFTLEEINTIQNQIMYAAKLDISGPEKLAKVSEFFRKEYGREELSQRALNFAIEYFVQILTAQKFLD